MARFLFVTWEGGGHVQPMLLVARGLIDAGHQVLTLSDACNGADAAALGAPFQAWRCAPSRPDRSPRSDPLKDWLATTPLEVIQGLVNGVMCGPSARYAADTAAAIDRFAPDVVVSQELLLGAMAAAEAKGVRLAIFAANIWSLPTLEGAPPFGAGAQPSCEPDMLAFYARVQAATRSGYQSGLAALNATRAALGLSPLADVFDQLDAAGRCLLATSRAFDFEAPLPASYRYVGPYMADPVWTNGWTPPWPADDARPLVLVSFSTMYQGQEPVLRRVIEALGQIEARGLVTLGPVLAPGDFPAPANVAVVASAPHSRVLPLAAAMVTHAGHASALRPLMAGVPLLCLPIGRDQPDNTARVAERGAGLKLSPNAEPGEIAAALNALLSDGRYRAAAKSFGARILVDRAAGSAETELIALAAERETP